MASSNAVRFLSDGSTDFGLSLERDFKGLVLNAFRAKTIFWDNLSTFAQVKVLDDGNSHQFMIGSEVAEGEDHTPGDELLGQTYSFTSGNITLDSILVRHFDVPLDQKVTSHFDVMANLAYKLGTDLAIQYDKRLIQAGLLAARTAAVSGYHNGGNTVEGVDASGLTGEYPATAAGAEAFRQDVAELAQLMDEDNVPEDGRSLLIPPYLRRVLGASTTGALVPIFDKDVNSRPNDLNTRSIGLLEGFKVYITNHLPSTNITTGPSNYQGDFSLAGSTGQPAALALCRSGSDAAIGVVQALGLSTTIMDDERRNTTFMKAQLYMGAGTLCPWMAGEIFVDNA